MYDITQQNNLTENQVDGEALLCHREMPRNSNTSDGPQKTRDKGSGIRQQETKREK